jgi:hypothetical protein
MKRYHRHPEALLSAYKRLPENKAVFSTTQAGLRTLRWKSWPVGQHVSHDLANNPL